MTNATCTYLLDVIVTHLKTTTIHIKNPEKLRVDVQFNNLPLQITSSRINVHDFKGESTFEFQGNAQALQENIETNGMPVTVRYYGKVIGKGNIKFPSVFTSRIDEYMDDILCESSCNFELQGTVTGVLEVLCRLYLKCNEMSSPEKLDCNQKMKQSIHPSDIMFVLGETQHCATSCDFCPDILQPDDDNLRSELDSTQVPIPNADPLRPMETLAGRPVASAATCGIKTLGMRPERFVELVARGSDHSHPFKLSARKTNERISDQLKFLPNSRSTPNIMFSFLDPAKQVINEDVYDPQVMPGPISEKYNAGIKEKRFCPICLTNMSWLPKFATCVNCGIKPVIEEQHKEKTQNADEILYDILDKPAENIEEEVAVEGKDQKPGCRCTCSSGRTCAHCRIRKLCADIFHDDEEPSAIPDTKTNTIEDICMENKSSVKSGVHLTKVFSELRDLYDINTTKLSDKLNEKCDLLVAKQKDKTSDLKAKQKLKNKSVIKAERAMSTTALQKRSLFKERHKLCVQLPSNVPPNHGWAWTSSDETRKYGWQPGFVRKSIKKIMKFFLQYLPERNAFNRCMNVPKKENEQTTLHVSKKRGEIFITLRAANSTQPELKPIVFKIVKSDLAAALSPIKKKLKAKGFPKCTCHKPLMMCVCRSNIEKRELEDALRKECKRRGMESCVNDLVLTDTSDSELEFDINVTAPTGDAIPKPQTVNQATQLTKVNLCIPPKYPLKQNLFRRVYDCAASGRYTGTAFGGPAEIVLEDGVFGNMNGGLYAGNTTPWSTNSHSDICRGNSRVPMRSGQQAGGRFLKSMFAPNFRGRILDDGRFIGERGGQITPDSRKKMDDAKSGSKLTSEMKAKNANKENENGKRKLNWDTSPLRKNVACSKRRALLSQDRGVDTQQRRCTLRQVCAPSYELVNRRNYLIY
ncbi:uncharacterized protein LOC111593279 [Drosophila hydei]|uniref:Uncharacterized protein LOC111593279 n=1 Tax=Drosophila hydei TaxID=7224 RepID=A0A6J1L5F1_DROHY|nr:uncharacterized protein LOC111593279 [Drosophila hydei]